MNMISKILIGVGSAFMMVLIVIICAVYITRWVKVEQIKITTSNGIQENNYVTLGGIQQYIQIRGEDTSNPVIVFLHGGPGNTIGHLAYYYQTELESMYTFVNWDQRGSGRTYYKNEELDVTSQLSTQILLNDLDELVEYIRERFNQEQVIIMGHSWGTLLGSQYVLAHPEKVSNYIGVGQVVSLKDGYIHSAHEAIQKAKAQGDNKVAKELEEAVELFGKTSDLEAFDFENFIRMQQYSMKYNAYDGELSTFNMLWMMITSPELSWEDIKWFFKTSSTKNMVSLQGALLEDCFFKLHLGEWGGRYEVPVHYITGAYDISTPIELLETYYNEMTAPIKSITCIPDTGHLPFFDNPQAFAQVIKSI